jgi:DNA-binding MarR family transcriptional regulator
MFLFQKSNNHKKSNASNTNNKSPFKDRWSQVIADYGHTEIPNLLFIGVKDLDITPTEFLTLTAILSFKFGVDMPWPSVSKIASRTNTDQRNVRKHLESLEKKGLIKRIPGKHSSNDYDFRPLLIKLEKIAQSDLALGQKVSLPTVINDLEVLSELTPKEDPVEKDILKKTSSVSSDTTEYNEQIQHIYDYYIKQFDSNSTLFKLTPKRKTKIKARLRDCGQEMLTAAIDNAASTKFYRGDNPSSWKADLDFITKTYEQTERLSNLKPSKTHKEIEKDRKVKELYESFTGAKNSG